MRSRVPKKLGAIIAFPLHLNRVDAIILEFPEGCFGHFGNLFYFCEERSDEQIIHVFTLQKIT